MGCTFSSPDFGVRKRLSERRHSDPARASSPDRLKKLDGSEFANVWKASPDGLCLTMHKLSQEHIDRARDCFLANADVSFGKEKRIEKPK
eukprot:671924-Prymnesium_polylepis.1